MTLYAKPTPHVFPACTVGRCLCVRITLTFINPKPCARPLYYFRCFVLTVTSKQPLMSCHLRVGSKSTHVLCVPHVWVLPLSETTSSMSQMSMWTILKSPLLASADFTNVSQDLIDVLSNEEVLAISDDPLGWCSTIYSLGDRHFKTQKLVKVLTTSGLILTCSSASCWRVLIDFPTFLVLTLSRVVHIHSTMRSSYNRSTSNQINYPHCNSSLIVCAASR